MVDETQEAPTATISCLGFTRGFKAKYPSIKSLRGIGTVNLLAYSRLLAKIAHAAAIHHLGIDGFEPLLTAFILSGTGTAADYIGCPPTNPNPDPNPIHQIEVFVANSDTKSYVLCEIRLFANFQVPPYLVVTGIPNSLTEERLGGEHFHE